MAHYDLGFLLNKRGMKDAALQEFSLALQLRPGMVLARQWVERLTQERSKGRPGPWPHFTAGALVAVAPQSAYVPPETPPAAMAPSPRVSHAVASGCPTAILEFGTATGSASDPRRHCRRLLCRTRFLLRNLPAGSLLPRCSIRRSRRRIDRWKSRRNTRIRPRMRCPLWSRQRCSPTGFV